MPVENPPAGVPVITPYLLYSDVDGALEHLVDVFGFVETVRIPGPDGRTYHAEVRHKGALVMMGYPGPEYEGPALKGGATQYVYVYVDDVDAHCHHIARSGGKILGDLADTSYGDRTFTCEDPEGHMWTFAQRVR